MEKKVTVYIEIEKGSNQKFEYNHATNSLELDRVLKAPYIYPYAYGFIINTLGKDGDELDALIITDTPLPNGGYHEVYIVGVLVMEDEHGMDEKILCVLESDYNKTYDLVNVNNETKDSILHFFTNYKNNTEGRWSKVYGFEDKKYALKLYEECLLKK
jgi:inorganic pyrophosphatase